MSCEQTELSADRRVLDLLVDGELDDTRRREVLSRLDSVPDGWKQCAVAFLEAQALRAVLRAPGPAAPARSAVPVPKTSSAARAAKLVTVAGLLVAAFCAGWLLRPANRETAIAKGLPASWERSNDARVPARRDSHAERGNEDADGPTPAVAPETGPSAPKLHLAGIVTLQIDDRGRPVEVQVPVLTGSDDDLKRLLDQPPAIEPSVVQALERRGHKVAAHRQLVAVDLRDGRRLLFPIDQVDVRFAQRVFQ